MASRTRDALMTFIVLVTVFAAERRAVAECVNVGGRCADFERAARVFLADVMKAEGEPQTVTFNVIEAFKGVQPGQLVMTFTTIVEDARFQAGTRVLAFTATHSAVCTRTHVVTDDDADLAWVRARVAKTSGAEVHGLIRFDVPKGELSHAKYSATLSLWRDAAVIATLPADVHASWDEYDFGWQPPGRYVVRAEKTPDLLEGEVAFGVPAWGPCVEVPPLTLTRTSQ
jgi:hypothetical protein